MSALTKDEIARIMRRPEPAPPRAYQFPRFERRALANGLKLVVAPVRKLPLVTAVLVVEAGAVADPVGQEGTAQLTAQALLEGTTRATGEELTERFERLGATVSAGADFDIATVTLTAMTPRLAEAFPLFAEVVRAPAFPEREVERLKGERLAELLHLRTEPRGLADEMFSRFAYASASRYARPGGGSEASVKAIEPAALRAFYEARYRPAGMTLVVAGDVTADEVERLATRAFGDWTAPTPPVVAASAEPARTTRAVHLVAKGDAPQSELRIGHVGVPRGTPDYFPLVVMNAVLGGLFSSRINLNLRERHGYTYGAHSGFEWRRLPGPFTIDSAVKSEVTEAAVREVLHEVDRMRGEAIGEDELTLATSYLDGVFPIRYETTGAIAAALANLVIYGLADDYFDTYRERIRGVTRDEVLAMAQRHLHPEALQVVVVGDPAQVRAQLEALAFGPLTVYDTEGKVVG